jgi:hypothetical protein
MRLPVVLASVVLISMSFGQSATQVRDQILGSSPVGSPTQSIPIPVDSPQSRAERILQNPLYRESLNTAEGESWLNEALNNFFERLGELLGNMFNRPQEQRGSPIVASQGVTQVMIVILLAVLAAFVIYLISQIKLKRKPGSEATDNLMSEEEARRSADQWLTEADKLAAQGEFRAAVRCLYLACLIRMDESNTLRFERHQTNWEHLYRFRDLTQKPGNFQLEPLTQKFDNAWYGFIPQTQSDVDWFKSEYQALLAGLRGGAA